MQLRNARVINDAMPHANSFAKVNLSLDILGIDPSGYHQIHTIFCEVKNLFDEITIELFDLTVAERSSKKSIEISCNDPTVPTDHTNTAYRAAMAFREKFSILKGIKITIKKRIPLQSGLGGGSSNAAAVLKMLAQEFKVNCCVDGSHSSYMCGLNAIAREVGMDCPFFLIGGIVEGTHFGEKLTVLPPLPSSLTITILDTGVRIPTVWAYENINLITCGVHEEKTRLLINALNRGDAHDILENLHNDFETLVFEKFPELESKKEEIEKTALQKGEKVRVMLAGSGGALCRIELV